MKNSYQQRLLRVDLTDRKAKIEEIDEVVVRRFVKGSGAEYCDSQDSLALVPWPAIQKHHCQVGRSPPSPTEPRTWAMRPESLAFSIR